MIIEYHRPSTVDQALQLLTRPTPKSYPLGGGSWLSRKRDEDFAVVDLQGLKFDEIEEEAGRLAIGATVRLQKLVEMRNVPGWLKAACMREASRNLREMSTIAGTLVGADGRSPLAMALLACDARFQVLPGDVELTTAEFFATRKSPAKPWLIAKVLVEREFEVRSEFVARSPLDVPLLGVVAAFLPDGVIRIVIGGFDESPVLVYEGTDVMQAKSALHNTLKASGDQWASAEYRQAAAAAILDRLLQS